VDPKDPKKAAWDQQPALQGLQWLHDRMWRDTSLVKQTDFTQMGVAAGSPWLAVSAGKLAMLLDGSWSLASWARSEPQAADQWDVAVLPRGPVGKSTYQSSDGWGMWNGGKHQEAAWELLKFLQDKEWVELAATEGGRVPARKSMQDSFAALVKKGFPQLADKNLAAFTDPIKQDYAHAEQFFAAKDTEAKAAFTDAINAVFVKNEQPVSDGFRSAAQKANALVAGG
jgi:ABC-type glycerol-3-phosphate transport system substrate-binding protein